MFEQIQENLNPNQLDAVTSCQGPVLVIAGAGSGKTRTIVYRLAYLIDKGVDPSSILLLTFTRKASQEMLLRAGRLLGQGLHGVSGGTFHAFAYNILRKYGSALGFQSQITILDRSDAEEVIKQIKEANEIGKKDRSFPKKNTVLSFISKMRNKELNLESLLEKEAAHLLPYAEDLLTLDDLYQKFKFEHNLLDYDDLLFYLEKLLLEREDIKQHLSRKQSHIMVDEYQDTNLVQGRIVRHLAGEDNNIMVVGDDAQSIYSFRGATVNNILNFNKDFPDCKIIKLEQNYRSNQPILDLSNQILSGAKAKYNKKLFTTIKQGTKPEILRPLSDQTQSNLIVDKIMELSRNYQLSDIAVLFRSGFQSYSLEVALNRAGIQFTKYGGQRFTEAAHIKDVLAHLRLIQNPTDLPAWQRAISLLPGIGPKLCQRLYNSMFQEDKQYLNKTCKNKPELNRILELLDYLRQNVSSPFYILNWIIEYYTPILKEKYPDDYPKRQTELEQLSQIAGPYSDLDVFLSDMSLENPEQIGNDPDKENSLTLSTVHSAKGLEWPAVFIIDLVEERFPSRHAMLDADNMEEERRLFYVACTRAQEYLGLSAPESLYKKYQNRCEPVISSPFIQEISPGYYQELKENYSGRVEKKQAAPLNETHTQPEAKGEDYSREKMEYGFCRHKIFGRGKIVSFIPPNKFQVNFPGFGLKVILGDYLQMEAE